MKIVVASFVIAVLLGSIPFESACTQLENDVLRLHILANSDSESDQELKLKVRDRILCDISPLYNGVKSKKEALEITEDNLSLVESIAAKVIKSSGYNYDVSASIKNKYFNTRYYENFTMPAGMYDTLEITIGDAKGKNWWCVMYPTLCVGAACEKSMKDDLSDSEFEVITSNEIEFRFKIVEYFERISTLFN
ncbi:MAG: stage II sporulation protein R [Ruminococcus sp.]|nr:stage II sporulation protein R [Ruminococcus sp.]